MKPGAPPGSVYGPGSVTSMLPAPAGSGASGRWPDVHTGPKKLQQQPDDAPCCGSWFAVVGVTLGLRVGLPDRLRLGVALRVGAAVADGSAGGSRHCASIAPATVGEAVGKMR